MKTIILYYALNCKLNFFQFLFYTSCVQIYKIGASEKFSEVVNTVRDEPFIKIEIILCVHYHTIVLYTK